MGERDRHSRSERHRSSRDERHRDERRDRHRDERESRHSERESRHRDERDSRRRDREDRHRDERDSRRSEKEGRHRDSRESRYSEREDRHRSEREDRHRSDRGSRRGGSYDDREKRKYDETDDRKRRREERHSDCRSEDRHRAEEEHDDSKGRSTSRTHHSSRRKAEQRNRLQMFPFIGPEKAPILAGNTLFPYAVRMKNRVYVGNMGPDITPEDLRSALTPFGTVVNIAVGRSPEVRDSDPDGVSMGFCFVDFSESAAAEKLLSLDPPVIRVFGRLLRIIEPRFHLDNIEKERFMSVENAQLLVQAGVIEPIEEKPAE